MLDEDIKDLPAGWVWAKLEELVIDYKNDIVDGPFGSNLHASEYVDQGVPLIRLQNIDRNRFLRKNIRFISYKKADELKRHSYSPNDIVITKLGEPLAKACLIPEDIQKGIVVADVVRMRVNHPYLSKRYIVYCINSDAVIRQLPRAKGSTRPRLNLANIRAIKIPLAPLPEQYRIVSGIEELFAKLDSGILAALKVKALLKQYHLSILTYAIDGKLTKRWREINDHYKKNESVRSVLDRLRKEQKIDEQYESQIPPLLYEGFPQLPEGWEYVKLNTICKLITKGESPKWQGFDYIDNGITFVRSENVLYGQLDISNAAKIPKEFHSKLRRSQLKPDDVLINLVGASIGRCSIVPASLLEANINQAVGLIRVNHGIVSPLYLMYLLLSPQMQQNIHRKEVETARPNISLIDVNELLVPICPLTEQYQITKEVQQLLSVSEVNKKIVEENIASIQRLQQSILKYVFEGKLVRPDSHDEPAEKLLERIKTRSKKGIIQKQV